jgi:hypothetical protein
MRTYTVGLARAAFATAALHAALASAAGPLPRHGDASRSEFTLQGGRAELALDYGGTRVDTRVDMVGLALRQRMTDSVHLGLLAGWSAVTQADNPLAAGLQPHGFHAGLSLDVDIITLERWSVFGAAAYVRQHVEDEDVGRTIQLQWGEWRAGLGGSVRLATARLYGGASYGAADGTQRAGGTVDNTTSFDISGKAGGFVGLDLRVEADGYIGAEARTGLDGGWLVYFRHRF